MQEFKLSRKLLSAYYIAGVFSYFVFQLIKDLVITWSTWLASFLSTLRFNMTGNGPIWLVFFLVCLFITFLIRKIIVEPLGFYVEDEGAQSWELFILFLLVIGSYIYFLNLVFEQPMPEFLDPSIVRLLGGYDHTFQPVFGEPIQARNAWTVVPWLWYIGPIGFLYARVKFSGK